MNTAFVHGCYVFNQRLFTSKVLFSVKLFVTSGFLINISTLLSTNHRPRKTDYSNIENRKTRPAIIR